MKIKNLFSSVEISPLAFRGLLALGAILIFLLFDRLSSYNADLQDRQRDLQTQLAQLKTIQNSDDPQAILQAAEERAQAFETRFLAEETTGLNTAQFQVELISILEACGAEQSIVDIVANDAEDVANVQILEANVRMRADLLVTARCLHGLNESAVRMDVASMRWNMPQQLLLQVRAFAVNKQEAGT
ncbi:MAG: hypothetical protein AAFP97_06695 [Pseudomonadota bacterium]